MNLYSKNRNETELSVVFLFLTLKREVIELEIYVEIIQPDNTDIMYCAYLA